MSTVGGVNCSGPRQQAHYEMLRSWQCLCACNCDLSRTDLSRWAGARGKIEFSAEMPLCLSEIGSRYDIDLSV